MLHTQLNLFATSAPIPMTPPSPIRSRYVSTLLSNRPLACPPMDINDDFILNESREIDGQQSRSSSVNYRSDKAILVIEFLDEKLREYSL